MKKTYNNLVLLSISVLVIGSTIYGLLGKDIYALRLNNMTIFELYGQDIFSLIIGIGLFVLSFIKISTITKKVLEIGFLVYISYIYAYFSFGLLVSKIYILYLVILAFSFYLLMMRTIEIYKNDKVIEKDNYQNKSTSVYIFVIVGIVTIMDIKELVLRSIITTIQINPQIVFCVLDLSFLFPAMVISSILNIKRRLFGIIMLGVFLIKTIALMPAIILSDILHYINLGTYIDSTFDIIASFILLSAVVFFIIHISKIKNARLAI